MDATAKNPGRTAFALGTAAFTLTLALGASVGTAVKDLLPAEEESTTELPPTEQPSTEQPPPQTPPQPLPPPEPLAPTPPQLGNGPVVLLPPPPPRVLAPPHTPPPVVRRVVRIRTRSS